MKKIAYFVILILSFCLFSQDISASKVVVITGYDVRFRDKPTTSGSNIIASYSVGKELTLINDNAGSGNGCNSKWYQASNGSVVGYVCSEFATIKEVTEEVIDPANYPEYSDYLTELGFPNSYLPALIKLHNAHPNWQFKVFKANIDFNTMVNTEYTSDGRSLIEDTGRYIDGYKSTDSFSYNYLTDVFKNNFEGGGKYWFAANKNTISYYMDPRNFLNDKQVFMFETLSYNESYHTSVGVEAMLKGTFMTGYANKEKTKTYVDAFIDAAKAYNISPYVLISRVIQEVGAQGSTIVSGTVAGYVGYYNFYNIEAHGYTGAETIARGLKYAREQGWDSPYKAILGGAYFLVKDYLSQGQDTLYLQKWDLFGPNYGAHQYMQNIEAPSTESIKTYNGYNNIKLVDSSFVFTIPVFNNMPDKTSLPNSGNPNNYLKKLSVNGTYLFETTSTKTTYNLILDGSTKSIEITADKLNDKASVAGTGTISLNSDKQSVEVIVTAENGAKRKYTINITRNSEVNALDISEILRVLKITNDGTYIYGYQLGTDITKIIKSITDKENKATVKYYDKDNKEKKTGIVASGDKINIKTDREEKQYTLIIYGDVNGDGKIAASDYVMIKNHIMDTKKLTSYELISADVNRDNKIAASDYVMIKNHIMDVKPITQ